MLASCLPHARRCFVLYRHLGNPREALRRLNLARKDPAWSSRALTQMVEIYLNPDNSMAWTEGEEAATAGGGAGGRGGGRESSGGSAAAKEEEEEQREAIGTASALLQQLRPEDVDPIRYMVGTLGMLWGCLGVCGAKGGTGRGLRVSSQELKQGGRGTRQDQRRQKTSLVE